MNKKNVLFSIFAVGLLLSSIEVSAGTGERQGFSALSYELKIMFLLEAGKEYWNAVENYKVYKGKTYKRMTDKMRMEELFYL